MLFEPGEAAAQQPLVADQVVTETNGGALLHKASGYLFPPLLGDMPRRKVQIIAADDVMVQYTLRGGGNGDAWMDLIVYPAKRSVEEEAAEVELQLKRNLRPSPVASAPPLPKAARDGRNGWYRGTIDNRTMTSGYVIVKRGPWYILARATSPEEAGQAGMDRLIAALEAVDWAWIPPGRVALLTSR